jgi:hypothetical protein
VKEVRIEGGEEEEEEKGRKVWKIVEETKEIITRD